MANIKKHVGKVRSTDKRCVVVFMQLPDEPTNSLIIDVEALQPRYEQILLDVVDSAEGQNETDLASAMARRTVQDSGRTVLAEFHAQGLMRKEPIDNIIMMPRPNTPFPLRDILEQLGKLNPDAVQVPPADSMLNNQADVKYNPVVNNMNAADEEKRQAMASNFLAEAQMLDAEANRKREQAYQIAPELRPRAVTATNSTSNVNPSSTIQKAPVLGSIAPANTPKKRGRPPKSSSNV